jgi:cobalt-zinc-cadmium efflux system membrane fusion protein
VSLEERKKGMSVKRLINKTTVGLLTAFVLGGVSIRLWMDTLFRANVPHEEHADEDGEHKERERGEHGDGEHGDEEGHVTLTPAALQEAGITIAEASGGNLEQTLTLPGELTLNADRVAHIVPRVSGVVQKVTKHLGDDVKPGEVLAVLESRDLAETKAAYLAAKQRLVLAQATLKSAEELREKRLLPGLEYLQTKREFADAEIELRTVTHKLLALGLTPDELEAISHEKNASFAAYELRASSAGTVVKKHITLGEVVESNSDVFVIADLSTIWANVSVYAHDAPRIRVGQTVHIAMEGFSVEATGQISYLSPIIDEETRTATARVLVPNPEKEWKPGTFVTARIVLGTESVRTLVPNDAIQLVNNQSVVFVPEGEGHTFAPRSVATGRTNSTHAQILSGLEPGDRYVLNGAFVLKAELGKGEGGHEH